MAEVSFTEGKGVNTFLGPANTYKRGTPANIPEGFAIGIVCQERNGQSIHDPEGDPKRYKKPWPVWDKLSSGAWISDLYTKLPKKSGSKPPAGIPAC